MWPTFIDGDEVIFESFSEQKLTVGDVVVAIHPFRKNLKIVKRISCIDNYNRYHLEGDNPDPLSRKDGHNFGPINIDAIYAVLPKDMIHEVPTELMRERSSEDELASAGISALVIFIAMIIVSSIISALIINSLMMLLQDSQNDSNDTEKIIYGKIILIDATITSISRSGGETIDAAVVLLALEMAPGSTTMNDEKMLWTVYCPNENDPDLARWSNVGNLESATTASGSGSDVDAIDTLTPGGTYMFALALYDDNSAAGQGGCPPNEGETHTLVFAVEGGGSASSWDLRYKININEGDQLI